jgi:hypothetical protein
MNSQNFTGFNSNVPMNTVSGQQQFAPVQQRRGRGGRGRGSASRSSYNFKRKEKFREDKGDREVQLDQERIKDKLFVGTAGEDDALARLQESQTLKAITLSITTRGIGFGLCHLVFLSSSYNNRITIPNIYAMYRSYLGVVEAKLQLIKRDYPLPARNSESTYDYQIDATVLSVAQTVTVAPEPIRRIINAIGIIKHEEKVYIPAVSTDRYDNRERFVPRPEALMLSNLRTVVVSLSNPQTPEVYRTRFEANNPIPGAIWANHLLQNPDEIIPANYDLQEGLRNDILVLAPYMAQLQKHVPKMIRGAIDYKSAGKISAFIANEMETLVTPPRNAGEDLAAYYRRCIPVGNIYNYFSPVKLTAADRLEGQITLLGEQPTMENYMRPLYTFRDENVCSYEMASDYKGVAQIMYAL